MFFPYMKEEKYLHKECFTLFLYYCYYIIKCTRKTTVHHFDPHSLTTMDVLPEQVNKTPLISILFEYFYG